MSMRQDSSPRGIRRLHVVVAAVETDRADDKWPAWASLLLVVGASVAAWLAIILTLWSVAG
jgi:hypothetical protein